MKKNGHTNRKSKKIPAFVIRAERAFKRADRKVKAQNRILGMPLIIWEDGKVVEKSV